MARTKSAPAQQSQVVVRLELTRSAKDALEQVSGRAGMTQSAVQARLLEWFTKQSDLVQGAVLGHYPAEIQAEVAELILRSMGKNK
jgi:hypothetical protein